MSAPTRFTSGITQAASFQPLGKIGIPDPFFYAMYEDDFLPYRAGDYTVTAAGGSVAAVAATNAATSGGRVLFTTGATISNFASIQQPVANFAYTVGKKLVFLTRIQVDDGINADVTAGLIQTTATPATVVNGIYFRKASGAALIVLNVVVASVNVGSAVMSVPIGNATDIDLGFYVDHLGNIKAFVGSNLEGFKRQNTAILGPNNGLLLSQLTAALPLAGLNPTLNVAAGTAVARTMTADFLFAAQER